MINLNALANLIVIKNFLVSYEDKVYKDGDLRKKLNAIVKNIENVVAKEMFEKLGDSEKNVKDLLDFGLQEEVKEYSKMFHDSLKYFKNEPSLNSNQTSNNETNLVRRNCFPTDVNQEEQDEKVKPDHGFYLKKFVGSPDSNLTKEEFLNSLVSSPKKVPELKEEIQKSARPSFKIKNKVKKDLPSYKEQLQEDLQFTPMGQYLKLEREREFFILQYPEADKLTNELKEKEENINNQLVDVWSKLNKEEQEHLSKTGEDRLMNIYNDFVKLNQKHVENK